MSLSRAPASSGGVLPKAKGRLSMTSRRSFLLAVVAATLTLALSEGRSGRCPALQEWKVCPVPARSCDQDEDCAGAVDKCCATACGSMCVKPLYTGCEQVQLEAKRRARALGSDGAQVRIPKCTSEGDFDKIQCDASSPNCWCVDASGFEVPGTRVPSQGLVNCSAPKPCGSHMCRMLCPHGFALDNDGCPMCQCHDPCNEVKCPGKLSCQLEDVACAKQPCPPVPKCKRGRSLENVCSAGEPLTISDTKRPFLCGTTPGKPNCPPMFQCMVQSGNDYGVCCPSSFKLQKAGSCPAQNSARTDGIDGPPACGMSCEHDLECPSMQKCCGSDTCGKSCTQPQNVTVCLQNKMLAELLVMSEKEGKGYVPQCSSTTGLFESRQCSRNGLVCWCVDPSGNKLPGSMGPSDQVHCPGNSEGRAAGRSMCDQNICAQVCQYGFKVGPDNCPTCECDDPCQGFKCATDEECVAARDEGCSGFLCPTFPVCRPKAVYVNPCSLGTPLSDPLTGDIVNCDGGMDVPNTDCPKNHECTYIPATAQAVCCPRKEPVEATKLGLCPFLAVERCVNMTSCETDSGCDGNKKCCFSGACGAVCASPILPTPVPELEGDLDLGTGSEQELDTSRPQTMCEYLRDFSEKMEGTREGMGIALTPPSCYLNGSFNATQCKNMSNERQCWCVDDFGTEIPASRSNGTMDCPALREQLSCLGMTCRLGCDYGFVLDPKTRCPRCECRNVCDDVTCSPGEECQMVEVNCEDEYCPPVPACLPRKVGQCPYLVPVTSGSCDYECHSDQNCNGTSKCCSNGCGTQCVEPVVMTACQHQRAIMQHKSHEDGIPARQMFMPACKADDGSYESVQCHPGSRQCWCVDDKGQELPGTRAPPDVQPSCQAPSTCPRLDCPPCEHGQHMDSSGCPTCDCLDPCKDVACRGEGEACRLVQVECVDRPCPPVPMCLPRRENPCVTGHPLLVPNSSDVMRCGPSGMQCPSSHKCHLSPLGEYAVCCPKPRDICFEPMDEGTCQSMPVPRWYFNSERNKCEEFIHGGCAGNQNNFESEKICNTVCPVLSQCERLREKNQKASEKYKKATFAPRCDPETGHWEPIQCLEHVGVCWCVNRAGEPIKGSLTRGEPSCSSRQGRRKMDNEPDEVIEQLLKEVALMDEVEEVSTVSDMPIEPLKTRCQALHEEMIEIEAAYTVNCDADGRFTPIQCYARKSEKFHECWCVDEAGNQLPNTTTFKRGEKICLPTPIKAVDVTLGFHGQYDKSVEKKMETKLRNLLNHLGAKLKGNTVDVEMFPDSTYIRFAIVGSNKVDVAYQLEEMVKSQRLSLDLSQAMPALADITSSRFSNRLADDATNEVLSDRIIALEHREVVSQSTVSVVTPYQTAIIVLSVGSAFIIFILVLVIALYRRKVASGAGNLANKNAGLDKHFLSQNTPVYVVSLPPKGESFPRVGLSDAETSYDAVKLPPPAETTINLKNEDDSGTKPVI